MDMERRAKEINSIMTADTGYGFTTAQITFEEDATVWGAFIIPKDHFNDDFFKKESSKDDFFENDNSNEDVFD